ncbi:kinase-like domain-containing protein [Rhizophagus clarus]|uniref:Kinase-like domain-containing protein n=1 Tax=Rhizophagus clarus TaxID=94130 RepID=A0A8H3LRU3_9GLOM|nr:kinase-like domain-containing protein [Rhizophagus clarus]
MALVNTNDDKFFDPTPKLKSSPIPILFVSFNYDDEYCIHCGDKYTKTPLKYINNFNYTSGYQKYCKKCLSSYISKITDNERYLDVYILTKNLECNEHEISREKVPQNIQECCRNCLEILCFKQIPVNYCYNSYNVPSGFYYNLYKNMIESEKYCKLCGKSFCQRTDYEMKYFKLCSDCYLISTECIESTLTKKPIHIIYLPWWHTDSEYCLTTNIIFGFTNHSQCKKCKRVSSVIITISDIASINSGNSVLDDFLINLRLDYLKTAIKKLKNFGITGNFIPYSLTTCIYGHNFFKRWYNILMEWIPYSQFTNVKEVARGGFSIIYRATWLDGPMIGGEFKYYRREMTERSSNETIILKRFKNSQEISKHFLNELKSNHHCYDSYDSMNHYINKTYGFTKDPESDDYIIVMEYASGGDLHNFLQKNFIKITWWNKISILRQISGGLKIIHESNFIHRDFHSGNILIDSSIQENYRWRIGDLGLSQPVNNTSSNNEIYGVIPYIAPEIFRERPEITEDTPECYANLMRSCWNSDPKKRPTIFEIYKIFDGWSFHRYYEKQFKQAKMWNTLFEQAEIKRKKLIESGKLGPKKSHPKAIYTSRSLSFFISKCSSASSYSKTKNLFLDSNRYLDYTSKELDLDIDIESRPNVLGIKRNIEELNVNSYGNNDLMNKIKNQKKLKIL